MDIADFLHRTLEAREDAAAIAKIREEVMRSDANSLCRFDAHNFATSRLEPRMERVLACEP